MRKLSKRAIITFIIAIFLTVMIPIVPVMAVPVLAVDNVEFVSSTEATAVWEVDFDATHGDVANLSLTAGAGGGDYAYARVNISSPTVTIADLKSDPATYIPTFEFQLGTGDPLNYVDHPDLEMLFESTSGTGYVEITVHPTAAGGGAWYKGSDGAWHDADGLTGAVYGNAYGKHDNGTVINLSGGSYALDDILTDFLNLDPATIGTWELTRVAPQLGWGQAPDLVAYVDFVTVDGVTYDLDSGAVTPTFSFDYVTGGDVDKGDKLLVVGSGVTAGNTVNIYWDYVTAAGLLNSTTGLPSGAFECFVTVPSAKYGDHYLWAKDLSTGTTISYGPITVIPKISLSPSSGLEDDIITVKGYGFAASSDIDITFTYALATAGTDETDALGYFESTFTVTNSTYGDYTVTATDEDANSDGATFTVGAALTLDKTVGPAGTVVKVDGRGFIGGGTIYYGDNITVTGGIMVSTKDGENISVTTGGTFTTYVVVPSVSEGDYKFTFTDGVKSAESSTFEVDGETSITVTPDYGTPGTTLTIKGYNFTQVSGTEVELAMMDQTAEATTDGSGTFTATIIIPPLDFGTRYAVTANDTRYCNAEDEVLVAMIVLQLSELTGPVGSEVTLMGSGFTEDESWNATFGELDLIADTDIVGAFTYFSKKFYVPSLPAGTYTINVRDITEKIVVGIDYTVTEQAAITVSRADVPNLYNLTLTGVNFAEVAGVSTTWWIYNSTEAWELNPDTNVTYGGAIPETDKYGKFTAYYEIPEFLELGTYTINATTVSETGTDPDVNQTAEVDITIVPEEVVLNVGSPSYARGQTITFVIKATLQKDPFYLGIKDPEGSNVFNTTWDTTAVGAPASYWGTIGDWFYIPSNRQIDTAIGNTYTLPSDAEAGTWTYWFWDDDKDYANGTFQVTELTEIEQLQEDIGEIVSSVLDLGTSITDIGTAVADVSGAAADAATAAASAAAAAADAKAAADSAAAAISDVEDVSNDALDAANDAKSAADAAKTAADSGLAAANDAKATAQTAADAANDAADAAEGAKTAASGLTTLVYGAIGASLIAALAAIVSLMQISRRIAG